MPKMIRVALSPEAVLSGQVLGALIWTGPLKDVEDEDEIMAEGKKLASETVEIVVSASKYDADHHFGPAITVDGPEGRTLEIIVPWNHVKSIVIDPTGKMDIGFLNKAGGVKEPQPGGE